ncbi:zinc ribbon domain-containing protein [Natronococcus sp. JC468]|uniref:FmdB family zinc ribbon protein n=1 Tax=Natronococcus sp. JC468 TaxID=1961921 RepID=UPI00143B2720|nr:zinc ribbon domain-containing protein [Natronococcus sp. JC468]NKE37579.1 zinc ribbon domain-containing protein [Natronococcus sp. JC468]
MGFFENLGRKVGEFTHEAKEAAADEAGYVCEACGNQFYTDQACPECGSERVTRRDAGSDDGTDDATEDAAAERTVDESVDGASPSTESGDESERE